MELAVLPHKLPRAFCLLIKQQNNKILFASSENFQQKHKQCVGLWLGHGNGIKLLPDWGRNLPGLRRVVKSQNENKNRLTVVPHSPSARSGYERLELYGNTFWDLLNGKSKRRTRVRPMPRQSRHSYCLSLSHSPLSLSLCVCV